MRHRVSSACVTPGPHAELAQEIAPAAAAIAALSSGFAVEKEMLQVLQALLDLALGLRNEFAASVAAAAAASVVNKAPKGVHAPARTHLPVEHIYLP